MNFDSKKQRQQSTAPNSTPNTTGRRQYLDPFSNHRNSNKQLQADSTEPKSTLLRRDTSGPLSVEEALKIRNNDAQTRPKFLSKAERAKLALERKQKEADEQRKRREEVVEKHKAAQAAEDGEYGSSSRRRELALLSRRRTGRSRSATRERASDRRSRSPGRRSSRRAGSYYDRDSEDLRQRERSQSPSSSKFIHVGKEEIDGTGDRVLTEGEREAIKKRYLEGDQEPKKVRKQSNRKVQFEWDASEDTSVDYSDLYNTRVTPQLFGRRSAAAYEGGESRHTRHSSHQTSPNHYDELIHSRLTAEERQRLVETHERKQRRAERERWDSRHWSEKPLHEMRDRDWRIFKEDYSISCKGGRVPNPYRSWRESEIPRQLLRTIDEIGYREPTPIQRQAIPIGLQSRDLIGIAETGSGKTASFLIPMLTFIMDKPPLTEANMADGPYALILAPTRELAQQIEAEAHKFCRRLGFTCVSIVGGHNIEDQAYALRSGAEIIIATPGRLKDCIDRRIIVLNQCSYVVMDEADRMIDMGFEEDVNFILDALPVANAEHEGKFRQTTMFSATMPPLVERMARKYLHRPATVTIGTAGKAVDTVEQRVEFISGDDKRRTRLLAILNSSIAKPPVIVFVNQKKNVDLLGRALAKTQHAVVTLHGGKTQEQRELALAKLKRGEADILVATDVAGRGIDVKDVSLVVNFDMAKDIEAYTHRIGRTGRAGKRGVAVTFVSVTEDRNVLYDLRKMVAASPVSKCPHELATHEAAQAPPAVVRSSAGGNGRQRE